MSPLLPRNDGNWLARLGLAGALAAQRAIASAVGLMVFLLLVVLLRMTLQAPTPDSAWLPFAMLASMPWSFGLLLLDASAGLADRGAWVVAVGLAINVYLLAWLVWSLRRMLGRKAV